MYGGSFQVFKNNCIELKILKYLVIEVHWTNVVRYSFLQSVMLIRSFPCLLYHKVFQLFTQTKDFILHSMQDVKDIILTRNTLWVTITILKQSFIISLLHKLEIYIVFSDLFYNCVINKMLYAWLSFLFCKLLILNYS